MILLEYHSSFTEISHNQQFFRYKYVLWLWQRRFSAPKSSHYRSMAGGRRSILGYTTGCLKKNNYKLADLKLLVRRSLEQVTPNNWMNAVQHTDKLIAEDTKRDVTVDHLIDSFVINTEDDTSDEESDNE